jgi:large subunit ribosomal protein L31
VVNGRYTAPLFSTALVSSPPLFKQTGAPDTTTMKDAIHPEYKDINVVCSCGNSFVTRSTLGHDLQIEVCSNCHPFYTGKQKIVDTGGRVDKFRKKYAR